MRCEHNIKYHSNYTNSMLWGKVKEIFEIDKTDDLCPLCFIQELANCDSKIGTRSKKVYNAFNKLCKAHENFINSLSSNENNEDDECKKEIKGPIEYLELYGENEKKANEANDDNLPF